LQPKTKQGQIGQNRSMGAENNGMGVRRKSSKRKKKKKKIELGSSPIAIHSPNSLIAMDTQGPN
jgi:hypothetical protein